MMGMDPPSHLPLPTKKYFGTFNEKWCEGKEFGFGKVDNFTVELILLLAFSRLSSFEGRHRLICLAASEKYKDLEKALVEKILVLSRR